MPRVVVAGSNNSFSFAVIDFTAPAAPTVVASNPMFGGGLRVAIDGTRAAVGNFNLNQVGLFNVTNPAQPALLGSTNVPIAGVGAIGILGNRVAVGELNQNRVVLVDFTNPANPVLLGQASTGLMNFFRSVAFLSPSVVVAGGPNDFRFAIVDFTNPASPQVLAHDPMLGGSAAVSASPASGRVVAGSSQGGRVKAFTVSQSPLSATQVADVNTGLPSVDFIALSGTLGLAGSFNSFEVARINFAASPPAVTRFLPGTAGNNVVAVDGTFGACGAFTTTQRVTLVDLAQNPPAVVGTLPNVGFASVSSIGMSSFPAAPPPAAVVSASPAALAFGVVRINTSSTLQVQIRNTGTAPLTAGNLQTTNARFSLVNPPANLNIPVGQNAPLTVRFSPNAVGPVSADLEMATNDPNAATFRVPLSGTGAVPQIAVAPAALNFGNVSVCMPATLGLTVSNTGGVALTIQGVGNPGPAFTVTGLAANAVIPPGGSRSLTVRFAPTQPGAVNAQLAINSDDPANPAVQVALTGTGVAAPAPSVSVTPGAVNFGPVRVQFWAGFRVTVANTNPCLALTATLTTSGAPFYVTAADPTAVPPMPTPVTDTIPANQSRTYVVVVSAQAVGPLAGTLTITGHEANNPGNGLNAVVVPLSATVVPVTPTALELVLDRSGSMSLPTAGGTRMQELQRAVKLFADLLVPGQGDEMGVVEFDYDDAGAHPPASVLTARGAFDAAKQSAVKTDVDTLTPRDWTSIGAGLQLAQNELGGSGLGRKAILVFTDGQQNRPPDVATVKPAIVNAGTEVYAVGLGQPTDVDSAVLSDLAATTSGRFFLTADTLLLRKHFVQVLADAFRQNMAADPVFTLPQGRTVTVPVALTGCDRRASFVASWSDPAAQVGLEVVAPDGTVYTAASTLSNQLVRHGSFPGYRYLQIGFPPEHPGAADVIGPQLSGTWVLRITGTSVAGPGTRCTASVLVESAVQLRTWVEMTDANHPIRVWAEILRDGARVCGAHVRLRLTRPTRLVFEAFTPAVLRRALGTRVLADATGLSPIGLASRALALRGRRVIPTRSGTIALVEQPDCRYRAELPAPRIDGVYEFTIEATGFECGGTFQRYTSYSYYVPRSAHRDATTVVVTGVTPTGGTVVVTLNDINGVALGPGLAGTLQPSVPGGQVAGVLDNLDGSYTIRVAWPRPRRQPVLNLRVGGRVLRVVVRARAAKRRLPKRRRPKGRRRTGRRGRGRARR